MSIPYFDAVGPVTLRFRAMPETETKAKYLDMPGAKSLIYNVTTLLQGGDTIHIAEGEVDCMTLEQMGLNAIGISGATKWAPHWKQLLNGYSKIVVLCDNDEAGLEMGKALKQRMPNTFVQLKPAPEGHDVNSACLALGRDALLDYWNLNSEEENDDED